MKTILEVSPRGSTLWRMPDEIYEMVNRALKSPLLRPVGRAGRSRSLSVSEAVEMLPPELQAVVTSEAQPLPEIRGEKLSTIYYDFPFNQNTYENQTNQTDYTQVQAAQREGSPNNDGED